MATVAVNRDFHYFLRTLKNARKRNERKIAINRARTVCIYHYTNLTFVCPSVSPGGHGKPFDPS